MKIVNKAFFPDEFAKYLEGLDLSAWRPELVVVHHTASPSLAMRPVGWKEVHMRNLAHYYGKELGWKAGPHVFTDEDEAWVLSPLTARGNHAVSFNARSWGIEMLGDFDTEDPWSGRGLQVLRTTAHVVRAMLHRIGKGKEAVRFHRDDPRTRKSCPGWLVDKERFLGMV